MSRNELLPARRAQPVPVLESAGEPELYAHLRGSPQAAEVLRVVQEAERAEAGAVPLAAVVAGLSSGDA